MANQGIFLGGGGDKVVWGVKLTIHSYLVLWLRMSGAIPPLSHMSGMYTDNFYLL